MVSGLGLALQAYKQPELNGLLVFDPFASSNSGAQQSDDYPYDCPKAHCTRIPGSCFNACCEERIQRRWCELALVAIPLCDEILALGKQVEELEQTAAERWHKGLVQVSNSYQILYLLTKSQI